MNSRKALVAALLVNMFEWSGAAHAQSWNPMTSPCPPGMSAGSGGADAGKCVGTATGGSPNSNFNAKSPVADAQKQYEQLSPNAKFNAIGQAIADNMKRSPTQANPFNLVVDKSIGAQGWIPPAGSVLANGAPLGIKKTGVALDVDVLEITEQSGPVTLRTTCAVPNSADAQTTLGNTYKISLPFFNASRASNGMNYCSPSYWPKIGATATSTNAQAIQNAGATSALSSASQSATASNAQAIPTAPKPATLSSATQSTSSKSAASASAQPQAIQVHNYFGASTCWSIDQLKADTRATNSPIVAAVESANLGGANFMYCVKSDGTGSAHLYSQSENRTCLPTASDSSCHLSNAFRPVQVHNYFGASTCWSIDQLKADTRATNSPITAIVESANLGGANFMYCAKSDGTGSPHLYSRSENRTCLPTAADSACHLGNASRPVQVHNYFGAATCWSIDQLKADTRATNSPITAIVESANLGGANFMYCVKSDGTGSPHLYSQSENRTCLPTAADSACHASRIARPVQIKRMQGVVIAPPKAPLAPQNNEDGEK